MAHQHRDRGSDNGDRGVDRYRPQYRRDDGPPAPPSDMFQFRGAANNRGRNDPNGRSDFTFRARPKISDRPLLRTRRDSREEEVLKGTNSNGDTFRNLEELTDSDEAEMEDSDEDNIGRPSAKRSKLDNEEVKEPPKWSNPDVYTSLPAPNETTGKKLDFVKLIRKARNANSKSTDLVMNDENFISFEDNDIEENTAPANAPTGPRLADTDRTLGKRKRGETTGAKLISRRGGRFYQDGMVLDEWRARDGIHPTPWLQLHAGDSAGLALHKEILDFYEWVRPRDYEFDVRRGVIDRLSIALNRIEQGDLKAFGSYAAGLYLPTGDMDLVYLPRGFNQRRTYSDGITPSQFQKYGNFIRRSGIAKTDSVILIPKAKVPIIKFVERISGLKVDLSFNNDTGVVAIQTFQKWRDQYPVLPTLVAVIKQFLMIRGLNDVAVGGLGGFSIICLVTSLLQHMPLSGTPPNLGELLIEFFNLYGNLLDRYHVGIRLEPPGYVEKKTQSRFMLGNDKPGRLMIIDPNRSENNISGGTHEIETVFGSFSRAHEILINRVTDFENYDPSTGHGFSFLEDLVGGDFRAYQVQRDILYGLHYGRAGPAPAVVPPPPPPIDHNSAPPPPPPPPLSSAQSGTKAKSTHATRGKQAQKTASDDDSTSAKTGSKKPSKAERRATRLKKLRPELAPFVGNKISLEDALSYGKYRDFNEMDKDLTRRELELADK